MKTTAPEHDHTQGNYKVSISEARLFIGTKHLTPSLILVQDSVLLAKNYSIPFNKDIRKSITIHWRTSQIEFDNLYQWKLPDVLILDIVADTEMSGAYEANPFHFQNFAGNYLFIQANAEQLPWLALQTKSLQS